MAQDPSIGRGVPENMDAKSQTKSHELFDVEPKLLVVRPIKADVAQALHRSRVEHQQLRLSADGLIIYRLTCRDSLKA